MAIGSYSREIEFTKLSRLQGRYARKKEAKIDEVAIMAIICIYLSENYMGVFFKRFEPTIDNDPYANSNEFQKISQNESVKYKGKEYREITYQGKEIGLSKKISNICLLILASITVLPLFIDFKNVKKLWMQIKTGHDVKVVLVAKHPLQEIAENKISQDKAKTPAFQDNEASASQTEVENPRLSVEKQVQPIYQESLQVSQTNALKSILKKTEHPKVEELKEKASKSELKDFEKAINFDELKKNPIVAKFSEEQLKTLQDLVREKDWRSRENSQKILYDLINKLVQGAEFNNIEIKTVILKANILEFRPDFNYSILEKLDPNQLRILEELIVKKLQKNEEQISDILESFIIKLKGGGKVTKKEIRKEIKTKLKGKKLDFTKAEWINSKYQLYYAPVYTTAFYNKFYKNLDRVYSGFYDFVDENGNPAILDENGKPAEEIYYFPKHLKSCNHVEFYKPDPTEYEDYQWCVDYIENFNTRKVASAESLLKEELEDEHGIEAAKAMLEQELKMRKQKTSQPEEKVSAQSQTEPKPASNPQPVQVEVKEPEVVVASNSTSNKEIKAPAQSQIEPQPQPQPVQIEITEQKVAAAPISSSNQEVKAPVQSQTEPKPASNPQPVHQIEVKEQKVVAPVSSSIKEENTPVQSQTESKPQPQPQPVQIEVKVPKVSAPFTVSNKEIKTSAQSQPEPNLPSNPQPVQIKVKEQRVSAISTQLPRNSKDIKPEPQKVEVTTSKVDKLETPSTEKPLTENAATDQTKEQKKKKLTFGKKLINMVKKPSSTPKNSERSEKGISSEGSETPESRRNRSKSFRSRIKHNLKPNSTSES